MSIAEVAKRAGVSRATVSRVINNHRGVSAQIVSVVSEAVAELGYKPPPLERRQGRRVRIRPRETCGVIAAVVLDHLYHHTPGVFAAHLAGIEHEAAESGWGVLVAQVKRGRLPGALNPRGVDGLILLGSGADSSVRQALDRFTCVWLSSHHDDGGDSVLAGNQQISRIAADYLLSRGHKHVGFLAVMSSYPAYPARADAFRFYARSAGATVSVFMDQPERLPGLPEQDIATIQRLVSVQVDRLVAASPRPSGLFVPNDMMTAMCYAALRARGVVPGRDVDIISCNNEESYLIGLDPRPATIDIGAEMIGRRSVEQLIRRIRHPAESRSVQIDVTPVLIAPGVNGRG